MRRSLRRTFFRPEFCLLEEHLAPRLSSYWKSHLPQGLMGCICALRRLLWWKENSDKINKMYIQGDFFHFPQNAWCLKTMLCAGVKLYWQIQANREILRCDWTRTQTLKKSVNVSVNPAHKNLWEAIFPATVFFFHFLKVWCRHQDYYSLFNLSDQLQLFADFLFCSSLVSPYQGENGLRRKRNEKYWPSVGHVLVRCLLF